MPSRLPWSGSVQATVTPASTPRNGVHIGKHKVPGEMMPDHTRPVECSTSEASQRSFGHIKVNDDLHVN